MTKELGSEPSPKQLAKRMKMPIDTVKEILKTTIPMVSMQSTIKDGNDAKVEEFQPDFKADTSANSQQESLEEALDMILQGLDIREQSIIKMRFGLGEYGPNTNTLDETAVMISKIDGSDILSRQRIEQIEKKAMNKLRASGSLNKNPALYNDLLANLR